MRFFEGLIRLGRGVVLAPVEAKFKTMSGNTNFQAVGIRLDKEHENYRHIRFVNSWTGAEALGKLHHVLQKKFHLLPSDYVVLRFGDVQMMGG